MEQLGATLQVQITVRSDDAQRPKCRWHLSAERQNEVQELLDGGVLNAASPPWYQALLAKYELALRAGKSTLAAASNERSRATVSQTQSEPNAAASRPASSPSSKRTCRVAGIARSERTAPVWQQQAPPSPVPSQQVSASTQQHGAPPSSGGASLQAGPTEASPQPSATPPALAQRAAAMHSAWQQQMPHQQQLCAASVAQLLRTICTPVGATCTPPPTSAATALC